LVPSSSQQRPAAAAGIRLVSLGKTSVF
jgi:hypothetical protein